MRVFKFTVFSATVFSALAVTGLAIALSPVAASLAELNDDSSQHLVENSDRRNTSYRGSGRREIVAFPTPVLESEA